MTLTRPLRRADGVLDASLGASALERQVRAYQPWPGSFLEVDGERLIVWAASVAPNEPADVPGSLVPAGDAFALVTADGAARGPRGAASGQTPHVRARIPTRQAWLARSSVAVRPFTAITRLRR